MRELPKLTDPVFSKRDYSPIDRFFLRHINDERDLPFVYLTLKISFTMIPLGILLYMPFISGWVWWAIALAFFLMNNFVYKGSFGLMLHCTSHRKWFIGKASFMNHYLPWFVGPFFGQTPNTYKSHHLGMHHRENNLDDDDSSTMQYQRDSLRDFHKYFVSFLFTAIANLVSYFHQRNQKKLRNKVLVGEITYWIVVVGLCFVNLPATIVVFIMPLLIARYIMMLGNFTQHAFVDPQNPGNSYVNSITCINTGYNHKCWNDGYHISHHIKPNLHWTEHPNHLLKNLDEYSENKALVFEGIHFLHVWFFLMRKDYDRLASHLVNLNGMFSSKEEAIELMKLRTQKIQA